MELAEYYKILDISRRRVNEIDTDIRRPLIDTIDWRDRLISIVGSRGTGKTTLLLQHIKENFVENMDKALYISLDNLIFQKYKLMDVVDMHYQNGGTHVFIDEIHYLEDWQTNIKNIYDQYSKLHICYTGSSLLKIEVNKGDLSRRQVTYNMPGLSFREYLIFENILNTEVVELSTLLSDHRKIAETITKRTNILKHFNDYLQKGYYPFYKEVYKGYDQRIVGTINQTLESDYPSVEKINYSTIQKIKKMLYILAQSCPQTPNMSKLYSELDTDRNLGLKMLYILEKANLINLLSSEKASLKNMKRPDKIYCNNTNIMYAINEEIDTGTKRETFFINQLRNAGYDVTYPNKGDFLIDGKFTFEVGGKTKTFDQIKDIENNYLAIDDIEVSSGNKIPLWMFGLLY